MWGSSAREYHAYHASNPSTTHRPPVGSLSACFINSPHSDHKTARRRAKIRPSSAANHRVPAASTQGLIQCGVESVRPLPPHHQPQDRHRTSHDDHLSGNGCDLVAAEADEHSQRIHHIANHGGEELLPAKLKSSASSDQVFIELASFFDLQFQLRSAVSPDSNKALMHRSGVGVQPLGCFHRCPGAAKAWTPTRPNSQV